MRQYAHEGSIQRVLWARKEGQKGLNFKQNHKAVIGEKKSEGLLETEHWHALIDDKTGERIKRAALSFRKAYKYNTALKGSGFSWHRVES